MSAAPYIRDIVMPAAFQMLPYKMATRPALAFVLAAGYQESNLEHRKQIGGPALGFWGFEPGQDKAWDGLLSRGDTGETLRIILKYMSYSEDTKADVLRHQDILAAVAARLLIWTHASPLPKEHEIEGGYRQYDWLWRPGEKRHEDWRESWKMGWKLAAEARWLA